MNINVEHDAMLERNKDSIYATKFYVMQKQIDELQQENKLLKNNWNKLKKWLEKSWEESQDIWFVKIIKKMQQLEQKSGNNE